VPANVVFATDPEPASGLRERKKVRTRVAIEDAALSLFEELGYEATTVEEIAARADVSTTTFFRYYPTKADVLVSDHGKQLPALHQAILDRPAAEPDLTAVWRAFQDAWVAAVDAERTARKSRIIATSEQLSGLSYQRGQRWLQVVTDALAQRNGLAPDDERCSLSARVALEAMASAVEGWIDRGCAGDLAEAVDTSFELMTEVCATVASPKPARR
jgi:AcrR family transcriptional regulator